MKVHAVWHCDPLHSIEHFVLSERAEGWLLRGVVMLPISDEHSEIRYEVQAGLDWVTQEAKIVIGDAVSPRTITVSVDDGRWSVDGNAFPELFGCIDLDLGWTPSTNTLPIRRLGLGVGEQGETNAAWLRFPEFVIEPATQSYARVADRQWRYRSGSADYVLDVTPEGVVSHYGDLWWGAVENRPG